MVPPEDERKLKFNWPRELEGETLTNWYYLCQNLQEVKAVLQEAIYALLTGRSHEAGETNTGTDVGMMRLFADVSFQESEENGFDAEWKEAMDVTSSALLALESKVLFEHIFRWWNVRPIHSAIRVVNEISEDSGQYIISTSLPQVSDQEGLPASFFHREMEPYLEAQSFLERFSQLLGKDRDMMAEIAAASAKLFFHKLVDMYPLSSKVEQRQLVFRVMDLGTTLESQRPVDVYNQLNAEQQQQSLERMQMNIWYTPEITLKLDNAEVTLALKVNLSGAFVNFDPETAESAGMEVDLSHAIVDLCRVRMTNKFKPGTTHESLWELRGRMNEVCEWLVKD